MSKKELARIRQEYITRANKKHPIECRDWSVFNWLTWHAYKLEDEEITRDELEKIFSEQGA